MENRNTEDKMCNKFLWRIKNFSTIDSEYLDSDDFVIDDQAWRIIIYPKGDDNQDYLAIFLEAAEDPDNLPSGWNKFADFKFTLISQVNSQKNRTDETSHVFNESEIEWGFQEFILLREFYDSSNGFILNDTCILQVEISVKKSKHDNGVDQSVSNTKDKSIELIDKPHLVSWWTSTSFGELVDFRGLGKVEQAFIPLLEAACSRYPSVIDSMQKRSQRFIEWALTALGRVLHFINNKKGRDMDDDACNHLQLLWDELQTCRFDLTWLEPYIKHALRMKTYVDRAARVKGLKTKLTEAQADLETKFTWKIKNFSTLDSKKLYSENFSIDNHTWRILIFPRGNSVDHFSIYLDAAADRANLASGWNKFADFKLTLINQFNSEMNLTKATRNTFNERESDWGFTSFIPLRKLCDSSKGFIVNDTCILQLEILVKKSKHHNGVAQNVSNTKDKSVELTDNPLPKKMISTSFGEPVDFRGLGKVEQDFVPLLEEICSRHPSLIDSMQKRSQRYVEWAFTAMGRVLHFLKNKKVRDMDDDAYNHLQLIWEELETFRFDLTWLEPHVKSALGMKTYVERAVRVKRLRENVAALEMEIKKVKTEMIEAELDLGITKRDLVKGNEGFEECDLDAELGYGRV